jgi:hypothetical protein
MTVKSRATLNSDADTNLADNTAGDITPADVRTIVKDLADSAILDEDKVTTVGAAIFAATAKTTPVDADTVGITDSAASNVLKKVTWANIKATVKTYFDTLYAALGSANTFTQSQTITGVDGSGFAISYIYTNAGAAGPYAQTYHDSASPAAADYIGGYNFFGRDSGGNKTRYVSIDAVVVDPTNGSEDGKLELWTMVAGAETLGATVNNGIIAGAATGAGQGTGTVNAVNYFVNGVNISTLYQPLDSDLTSIAALTTTAAGRSALTIADAGADRVLAWDDSAGTVAPIALADITAEAAPAAGDYMLVYRAEGDLVKVNWSDLPGVGGGISNVSEDTTPTLGGELDANGFDIIKIGVLTLTEQAAAEADVAGRGQIWVKTATPNELWFTDDAGTDFQVADRTWVAAGYQPLDSDLTTIAAANNGAVLAATTASFTTADETKLDGIETGADVTDAVNIASSIVGVAGKTTPVDADTIPLIDSAASNALKELTWANLKATAKTYFDTLYQPLVAALTSWGAITRASGFDTFVATPSSANLKSLITDETGSGGALVFATGPTLTDPVITGAITEDVYTITDGAAFEIDPSNGTIQQVTLGASRTPAATNFASGESVTLKIADGSSFTITWTTVAVTWVGGVAPTLATTGWTIVVLWKDGSTIYGKHVGDVA